MILLYLRFFFHILTLSAHFDFHKEILKLLGKRKLMLLKQKIANFSEYMKISCDFRYILKIQKSFWPVPKNSKKNT